MLLTLAFIIVFTAVLRLLTTPLRYGYRRRQAMYFHNPYRFGCRRHHGLLGRVLPVIALVAFDRLFGPRF